MVVCVPHRVDDPYDEVMAERNPDRSSYFPAIEKKTGQPMSYWFDVRIPLRLESSHAEADAVSPDACPPNVSILAVKTSRAFAAVMSSPKRAYSAFKPSVRVARAASACGLLACS